jgi:hypothetical protein
MRFLAVLAFLAAIGFGFEESFSGSEFPPRDWYQASTDVGTARWQRHDTLSRTEPGCGFCAGEKRNLRNADWLITPQCIVAAGDSFGFWLRARDAAFRESVEVWVSDSSPFVPDFRLLGAFATNSESYRRYAFDLSGLAGHRLFFAVVYVSAGGEGVLIDDMFGPEVWRTGDLAVWFPIDQPHNRVAWDSLHRPHARVHNYCQEGAFFNLYIFIHNKYGVRVYSQLFLDLLLGPGEDMDVTWPSFNPGNDTGRWGFRCSLSAGDLRRWNDTADGWFYIGYGRTNGGPDSAGYTWRDSDDSLGPEYQWIEVSGSGTRLGSGDEELFEVPLPWSFPFYGQNYSTAYVSTNGWLALGPPAPAGPADSNVSIPHPAEPNRLVAAYWDDLASRGSETGTWYQSFGDSLVVVEWHDFGYYGFEACSLSFEALLHRTGIVELQYGRMYVDDTLHDQGMSATVGIENAAGTVGLEYLHDGGPSGNLLWSGRAIRFLPREYGIAEGSEQQPLGCASEPSIVRGVLFLGAYGIRHTAYVAELLDPAGRKVMELRAGPNDVSRLASGVYFIRTEPSAVGRQPSAAGVRKVVIQR